MIEVYSTDLIRQIKVERILDMPSYETTIITKANIAEDQVSALKTKVEGVIQAHNGTLGNFEDWGTRRLSFEIQKENRGRYLYFGYTGNTDTVAEIERNFRINESVIRFLSINTAKSEDMELIKKPSAMKRPPRAKSLADEIPEAYE